MDYVDFDSVTAGQETEIVTKLKIKLRDVILNEGHYSGMEKPRYFAVYALLELAAEVSINSAASRDMTFFVDAANEVATVIDEQPERILNY